MFNDDEYFSNKDIFVNDIEKMNNSSPLKHLKELYNSSKIIYS